MDDFRNLHAEDGATKTLHAIQAGGQHLLIIARKRVGEVLDQLDAGQFDRAAAKAQELSGVLGPLANAQLYVAIADNAKLIRARDLRLGMTLSHVGEVTEVEVTECSAAMCGGHVKIAIGEHSIEYGGEVELYVEEPSPVDE